MGAAIFQGKTEAKKQKERKKERKKGGQTSSLLRVNECHFLKEKQRQKERKVGFQSQRWRIYFIHFHLFLFFISRIMEQALMCFLLQPVPVCIQFCQFCHPFPPAHNDLLFPESGTGINVCAKCSARVCTRDLGIHNSRDRFMWRDMYTSVSECGGLC